jgi:hypothetical protein
MKMAIGFALVLIGLLLIGVSWWRQSEAFVENGLLPAGAISNLLCGIALIAAHALLAE